MSSNPTVPTPARRPQFAAARGHLQSFTNVMGEELDMISSLPALQDGVEWDELRSQVHGHETLLTAVQGAVAVTQGDFTTLQNEVARIRGDVATLQGQFMTFQNVIAGLGVDTTRTRGNVTALTEDFRLLGEGLGQQIRAVSESTDRVTSLMNNQAGVNTRLEAL
ncbi:hypothetical protein E4U57_004973, partial [Claviceps arundinis]